MVFEIGDILEATQRNWNMGYHKIIYLNAGRNGDFEGAILTHSPQDGNLRMKKSHFKVLDVQGSPYKFKFDNTYLVQLRLVKPSAWGPYRLVGRLSKKGVKYVKDSVKGKVSISWDIYIQTQK